MKTETAEYYTEVRFEPVDNARLANLCGALEGNLREIEAAMQVRIARRNAVLTVRGTPRPRVEAAAAALRAFYTQSKKKPLEVAELQLGLVQFMHQSKSEQTSTPAAENNAPALSMRKNSLRPRTPRQADYLHNMQNHDITFGIGPAGTGKTFLAVACAVEALERGLVERIILTRPAVEAGERLGFLPGDLSQKVDPYLRPLYDALYDLVGFERVNKLFDRASIEIAPLAFMRGRTLNHAFIILDEAQNTTPEQMKMFLTRIGIGARAVVTGDPSQVDLPRGSRSGLLEACRLLAEVRGLAFTQFDKDDVVRHPLVARIVEAYAKQSASREQEQAGRGE